VVARVDENLILLVTFSSLVVARKKRVKSILSVYTFWKYVDLDLSHLLVGTLAQLFSGYLW
jgi:hypothetical protein